MVKQHWKPRTKIKKGKTVEAQRKRNRDRSKHQGARRKEQREKQNRGRESKWKKEKKDKWGEKHERETWGLKDRRKLHTEKHFKAEKEQLGYVALFQILRYCSFVYGLFVQS